VSIRGVCFTYLACLTRMSLNLFKFLSCSSLFFFQSIFYFFELPKMSSLTAHRGSWNFLIGVNTMDYLVGLYNDDSLRKSRLRFTIVWLRYVLALF
jgi:hypothetical protein